MTTSATQRLLVILLITVIVYLPGLSGSFEFDDYTNILLNDYIAYAELSLHSLAESAWSGGMSGPLKRPISMLSFAFNSATTGIWPMAFKITNLIVHLCVGIVVFHLAKTLIVATIPSSKNYPNTKGNPTNLALIVAAIWLLHPINLTSVLYVVQRMTSLSALFTFGALLAYSVGRLRMIRGLHRGEVLVYCATPVIALLGVLSKENAVLALPLIVVTEACFFRFRALEDDKRRRFKLVYLVSGLLLFVGAIALSFWGPGYLDEAYKYRSFSLGERVLTETRVLWFYISLIFVPRITSFALFHDDIVISTSIIDPFTTVLAVAGIVLLMGVGIIGAKKAPVIGFGLLWFLVGHALESSFMPLELVHEHRNYLPSFGLIFAATWVINDLLAAENSQQYRRVVAIVGIFVFGGLTMLRAVSWSDPVTLATVEAENHPNSMRSLYSAGRAHYGMYLLTGDASKLESSRQFLERAAAVDDGAIQPLLASIQINDPKTAVTEQPWWAELISRLQHKHIRFADAFSMTDLVKCHADKKVCPLSSEEVGLLYQSAISNRKNDITVQSQLLTDYAVLVLNSIGDGQLALELIDDAIELRPNYFASRKIRFQILLMVGKLENAEQELQIFEEGSLWEDVAVLPRQQLLSMRNELDNFRAQKTEEKNN